MPKFKFPKRFDNEVAETGVWFQMVDEPGNNWGSFKCALIDRTTLRWKNAVARLHRQQKAGVKIENFPAHLFVEMSLLEWKDIPTEDGKPMPFNRQNALEYFCHEDAAWCLDGLYDKASNVNNYQPDEAEAPEKN